MKKPDPMKTSVDKINRERLRTACNELASLEPALRQTLDRFGYPPLWSRRSGFGTLVLIILEQQVSLASARAVFNRLEMFAGDITPNAILQFSAEQLRQAGLTRQKATYCHGLASRVVSGETSFPKIARAGDENARNMLCEINGVGAWSADVYLLFALRRPDIWPSGDLALIKSVAEICGFDKTPDSETCNRMAEHWRPWRSAAARLLWHAYVSRRGR